MMRIRHLASNYCKNRSPPLTSDKYLKRADHYHRAWGILTITSAIGLSMLPIVPKWLSLPIASSSILLYWKSGSSITSAALKQIYDRGIAVSNDFNSRLSFNLIKFSELTKIIKKHPVPIFSNVGSILSFFSLVYFEAFLFKGFALCIFFMLFPILRFATNEKLSSMNSKLRDLIVLALTISISISMTLLLVVMASNNSKEQFNNYSNLEKILTIIGVSIFTISIIYTLKTVLSEYRKHLVFSRNRYHRNHPEETLQLQPPSLIQRLNRQSNRLILEQYISHIAYIIAITLTATSMYRSEKANIFFIGIFSTIGEVSRGMLNSNLNTKLQLLIENEKNDDDIESGKTAPPRKKISAPAYTQSGQEDAAASSFGGAAYDRGHGSGNVAHNHDN